MTQTLIIAKQDGITDITLNRTDKANALGPDLVEDLLAAMATAATDGTRLVILRGEGKSFCSGFDLSDLDSVTDGDLVHRLIRIETLLQAAADAGTSAQILSPQATADLFRVTATDTRDADMADIARTASVPGLKARIQAYREQALKAAGKK